MTPSQRKPKAQLSEAGDSSSTSFVGFDYNPAVIKIERQTKLLESTANSVDDKAQAAALGVKKLTINNLTLDGDGGDSEVGGTVSQRVERLLAWSKPIPKPQSEEDAKEKKRIETTFLPLIFNWGTGFKNIAVELYNISSEYTRFSATGEPTRATVGLTLHATSETLDSQNPTSGGLPDRSAYVVVDGDSLPTLAETTYGDPTLWRHLAARNAIEDPMRLTPGTRLYLPSRDELFEGGTS